MPNWDQAIRERLAGLNLAAPREAEIVEELSRHLEDRFRELLAMGVPEPAAARKAMDELEYRERLAEGLRSTRQPAAQEPLAIGSTKRGRMMTHLRHDWKVAFRMMRMKPGFSTGVIFMLALGVAGNTAIFSIFNGLFLRPLPFAEPGRLVDVDETAPKWNLKFVGISNFDAYAWQRGNATFDGLAYFNPGSANLSDGSGPPQRIRAAAVTHNLLPVLGLKPVVGRNFLAEEDRPGAAQVVMLGYDLWQRLYQGDRKVMGRVIKLEGLPFTIVGVLPKEAILPPDAEVWRPLAADQQAAGSFYLSGVGRIKHGVSLEQASADLIRVHKGYIRNGRSVNEDTSPVIQPLRDRYLGDVKPVMRILLAAVGVVLLIACVNIAGLMLVRGESRAREIAIRSAVGASRGVVARQLFTESFALALMGAVAGVIVGKMLLSGLVSLMPDDVPKWIRFDLDGRFALFCVALTATAAVLFGLAPALRAAAVDLRGFLIESGRSTLSRSGRGFLGALVVCEIALALMLLVGSGLLLQAFRKVLHTDPGFRTHNVLTWSLRLPNATYGKPEQQLAFYQNLVNRLKPLPGVTAASAASVIPLNGHSGYFFMAEKGRVFGPNEPSPVTLSIAALGGYTEAMGMTLAAGRSFEEHDIVANAPPVALINETFARFYWQSTDVVGRRISYASKNPRWMEVIGVVRDTRHYGLDGEVRPSVMVPFQLQANREMTMVVRTAADPNSLIGPGREVLRQVDPDLPMYDIRTMDERLSRSLWVRRAYSWMFVAFAAVAIVLAAAGIYGVVSFAVNRRVREIGIRMALGARPGQVVGGILGGGMVLVCAGVSLGLAGSLLTARFLTTLLFGVGARDWMTYSIVIGAVALVGLLANYVPARRAAQIDPVVALRNE